MLKNQKIRHPVTRCNESEIADYLAQLDGWQCVDNNNAISKEFIQSDYLQTLAVVQKMGLCAHEINHHPQIQVGYKRCTVVFTTHVVKGLSINDFIAAAQFDLL